MPTQTQKLQRDKELLAKSILAFKSVPALTKFLDDLLTEQEMTDLAQRLRIAKGIVREKTYQEVSEKVDASTTTVTKVGYAIKFGKGAFEKLFRRSERKTG